MDKGSTWKRIRTIATISLLAALVILIFQNLEAVPLRLLFWQFEAPSATLFLGVFLVGLVSAKPLFWWFSSKKSPAGEPEPEDGESKKA